MLNERSQTKKGTGYRLCDSIPYKILWLGFPGQVLEKVVFLMSGLHSGFQAPGWAPRSLEWACPSLENPAAHSPPVTPLLPVVPESDPESSLWPSGPVRSEGASCSVLPPLHPLSHSNPPPIASLPSPRPFSPLLLLGLVFILLLGLLFLFILSFRFQLRSLLLREPFYDHTVLPTGILLAFSTLINAWTCSAHSFFTSRTLEAQEARDCVIMVSRLMPGTQ